MDVAQKEVTVASVAHALGDERRVRMLFALGDGRALPATRLAMEAGVAPSTASAHLKRLVEAGLLHVVPAPPHHGRHRFYQLAGPEVAELCESFMAFTPEQPIRSLRPGTRAAAMRSARTCYDHIAGRLGVALMDAMLAQAVLVPHFALTASGEVILTRFGLDLPTLRTRKRPLIRHCTDWSEQRPHMSGALGSALRDQFEERGWLCRSPVDRAVLVTPAGRDGFRNWIGLNFEP